MQWDRFKFAQGVVLLAFDELLSRQERLQLAQAAVSEAGSTLDVKVLKAEGLRLGFDHEIP